MLIGNPNENKIPTKALYGGNGLKTKRLPIWSVGVSETCRITRKKKRFFYRRGQILYTESPRIQLDVPGGTST